MARTCLNPRSIALCISLLNDDPKVEEFLLQHDSDLIVTVESQSLARVPGISDIPVVVQQDFVPATHLPTPAILGLGIGETQMVGVLLKHLGVI